MQEGIVSTLSLQITRLADSSDGLTASFGEVLESREPETSILIASTIDRVQSEV